jgi:hypothetical protein
MPQIILKMFKRNKKRPVLKPADVDFLPHFFCVKYFFDEKEWRKYFTVAGRQRLNDMNAFGIFLAFVFEFTILIN